MVLGCSSCPYPLLFLIEWLGKGTFGTCQVMWYAGMNVAVKSPHHRIIQEKNVLMEAKMLQVSITTLSCCKVFMQCLLDAVIVHKFRMILFMFC